ncbi:MAG: DNA cytosine methyltransferase [bacterium]|nr:DNA cytosine methyltransferase [bacterium]
MKNNKITFIDLFCGAGGLSIGFESQGFIPLYANDIDKHSIETFQKNYLHISPDRIVCGDIEDFIKDKSKELASIKCDLVVGGPPCQGFSMANRQRLIDDPRNKLYKKFMEAISIIKPKMFLMENVKGMNKVADQVVYDSLKIGYQTQYRVLNAKFFGIPQNRERIFYIGCRSDKFKNPYDIIERIFAQILKHQETKEVPIKDALWGLRKLQPKSEKNDTSIESRDHGFTKDELFPKEKPPEYILKINGGKIPEFIFNHKTRYNNKRDIEIYRLLPQGGKSDHPVISHIMPYTKRNGIFKDKFYKLLPNEPSKTITSHMKFDCHMYIHPYETRGLTPREAARIQSFPDNYIFYGPFTQWYNQIGNSVPPILAGIIAKNVKRIAF